MFFLAKLHPCNNNHANRASNYSLYLNELNLEGFDFTNGYICSDVHRLIELNNFSLNIFELKNSLSLERMNYRIITIEISNHESDRVTYLKIYKNL